MERTDDGSVELGGAAGLGPIVQQVRDAIESRPYQTLGIALALGVVLGGGWGRWAVGALGRAGMRAALTSLIAGFARTG